MTRRSVSIKDVAIRAGVSHGTVSNVINRPEAVAEPTRQAVLRAIDELGYVRNASASRLRAKKSTVVGLVVVDLANPFVTDYVEAAEHTLAEHGYTVIVSNTGVDLHRLERALQVMDEYRVAGVILPPIFNAEIAPRIEVMRQRGLSFVFVGEQSSIAGCSADVDQIKGGRLVGQHLVDTGRRRIVYVGGPRDMGYSTNRLAGLRQGIGARSDVGLDVVRIPDLTGLHGYAAVDAILAHDPDAVFCANDLAALGVLRGLVERDRRIPDDVALVGYDDISFAELAAVPLTTVSQPARAIGGAAAELLIGEANETGHVHRQVSFNPELVVRRSTALADGRSGDPS